ncbi:MAG: nucleotidyltransferase domain-containing protein [Planctomycetota bacterium]|jgi:predicted nucleotidyltransferase
MDRRLVAEFRDREYPTLYATLCGDTLYGLESDEPELDVRACHVLPARSVVGLRTPPDSIAGTVHRDGLDFEVCSHELKKLCMMLLKKNGCVAEQVLSPHVVVTTPEHEELKEIVPLCYSRHMAHHFASQAKMQWQLAEGRRRGTLYAIRLLLSGIHLMRTGELVPDLPGLRDRMRATWLDEACTETRFDGLYKELTLAARTSALPAAAPEEARDRLDDLLVRQRMR